MLSSFQYVATHNPELEVTKEMPSLCSDQQTCTSADTTSKPTRCSCSYCGVTAGEHERAAAVYSYQARDTLRSRTTGTAEALLSWPRVVHNVSTVLHVTHVHLRPMQIISSACRDMPCSRCDASDWYINEHRQSCHSSKDHITNAAQHAAAKDSTWNLVVLTNYTEQDLL